MTFPSYISSFGDLFGRFYLFRIFALSRTDGDRMTLAISELLRTLMFYFDSVAVSMIHLIWRAFVLAFTALTER